MSDPVIVTITPSEDGGYHETHSGSTEWKGSAGGTYAQDRATIAADENVRATKAAGSKTKRQQIRDFATTIQGDKATIQNAPAATTANVLAQVEAMKTVLLHMCNGWLGLIDLLQDQVMQRDDNGPTEA